MCELTVRCPLCEATCFPRQELSCVHSSHGARIEWTCVCGAQVVLDAKVRPHNPFATGQKLPGEG